MLGIYKPSPTPPERGRYRVAALGSGLRRNDGGGDGHSAKAAHPGPVEGLCEGWLMHNGWFDKLTASVTQMTVATGNDGLHVDTPIIHGDAFDYQLK